MKQTSKKLLLSLFALVFVVALSFGLTVNLNVVSAQSFSLPFNEENWVVENGTTLDGSNALAVNKDTHVGANKLLVHTKNTYSDFYLSYKFQYADAGVNEPWFGNSGILIYGDGTGADGYYIGFYNWGNVLYAATGYYIDNNFYFLWGSDTGWTSNGLSENTIEIYVKDSHLNVIINGWLFQNAPLPYATSGVVSIYSDAVTGTYKDFNIQPLDASYDITSKLVRANWSGSNIAGDIYFWYEAGKDQTFKMQMPETVEGNKAYYLARRTKVVDGYQSVDVYLDKTATLKLSDTWTDKIVTWGDTSSVCDHGNGLYGLNMVELPLSAFEGVKANDKVGFLLDKNIDGWFSAGEYWLLYEDSQGVLRVADYMDLAYSFDTQAHGFEFAQTNSGHKGYHFVCQNESIITSHRRGQKVEMTGKPKLTAIKTVEYTFGLTEGDKTIDMSEYVNFNSYHNGCVLTYSVDGGEESSTVVLPNKTQEGMITVKCVPDGSYNDYSGAIYFNPITIEIPYKTIRTVPTGYMDKISDVTVFATKEELTVDLKEYVDTNIEGQWSYVYAGETVEGSIFQIPYQKVENDVITLTVKGEGIEKSVELVLNVTALNYPNKLSLPYYESGAGCDGWTELYGNIKVENGKWVADAQNVWGAMADFGTEEYQFQTVLNPISAGKVGKFGMLIHANVDVKGYTGMLIGLEYANNGLQCNSGWLVNGEYVALSNAYTYFPNSCEYYVQLTVKGSFVKLLVNGWPVFTTNDKYSTGSKFAILNDGIQATYRDFKVDAVKEEVENFVFRFDWNGTDTFSRMASWNNAFNVEFNVPEVQNATNYRLVRRTVLYEGNQKAIVSVNGQNDKEWVVNSGAYTGDVILPVDLSSSGKVTFTITPQATFKASYMWLIYSVDGIDYVADSIYFGRPDDVKAHGVELEGITGLEKYFIDKNNVMLLTTGVGEEVILAKDPNIIEKFTAGTYENSAISSNIKLPYRLYLPNGYTEEKEYPVLLFMHGAGERGNDNVMQVIGGNIIATELLLEKIVLSQYADDFIIVVPQCPQDMRWVEYDWSMGSYDYQSISQSIPSQLVESLMYNEIFANYSVDRSKVYGAGISMGGFGITDLAMRNPDLFAAIINSCGGTDADQYELLATTALRAYHSNSDNTVNNDELATLVENLKNANYEAEYYEINFIDHLSWIVAFNDVDVIEWLLSHEKTWTIKVDLGGGEFNQQLPSAYDKNLQDIILEAPTKEGYNFAGWYLDSQYANPIDKITANAYSNITLYAKWEKEVSYKIVSDDEIIAEEKVTSGYELNLAEFAPQKEGYVLIGWTDGETNYSKIAKIIVEEDVVLTAMWQITVYTVTVYDGEEVLYTADVNYGEEFAYTAPEKEGKKFVGFFADAEGTQELVLPLQITQETQIYCVWKDVEDVRLTMGCGSSASAGLGGCLVMAMAICGLIAKKRRS